MAPFVYATFMIIAGSIGSHAAAADDPTASESATPEVSILQEVVVTAQGRVQRLQDVPISASVINGSALGSSNLRDLQNIGDRLPAVKITPGPASDLLNIRGVGSGLNAGFEQAVATFVDGVYRGRSRSSRAALFDIDRVEILKGPQTTFFGNNAIAGALSITTRRAEPGGPFEYDASGLYSVSDGGFDVEAGMSAPLTDSLGVRVAAKYFGMDGYIRNTYLGEDGPHQRDLVGRVSFAWNPTRALRTDLRIDAGRFRDQNYFPNEALNCPAQRPPYPAPAGLCARYLASAGPTAMSAEPADENASAASRFTLDFEEIALTNELDLDAHHLTSVTSWYHHDLFSLTQLAPLPLAGVGGTNSPFPTHTPENYHSFSQELRLRSASAQRVEYMIGVYFSKGQLDTTQATGLYFAPFGAGAAGYTTAATPIAVLYYQHENDQTASAFGSLTAHLSDSLRFNGGVRYSSVKKEAFRDAQIGIGGDIPGIGLVVLPQPAQDLLRRSLGGRGGDFSDPDRTDTELMPSVSLQYDIVPDLMSYISYTKGFKAGGFALAANADIFNPETVYAYEVGLKGSLFDQRLRFGLAGFYSRYDDLQESTNVVLASGVIQSVVGNVAKAKSQGVELTLAVRATPNLSFSSELGYLDARYIDYPGAPCTVLQTLSRSPCYQDLSGSRRAYAPEFSGSVGASARYPVGRLELRIDPSVYFTTRYFQQASIDPLTLQSGYAKFDLRMGVGPADGRWELALIGKNLGDRSTGSFRNNIPTSPGTLYALPDPRRTVALQVRISGE